MAILYTWDYYLYKCHPRLMLTYPISSFIYLEEQNNFQYNAKGSYEQREYFIVICTNKLMFGKGHKCLFRWQVYKFSDYSETWTSEASRYLENQILTDNQSLRLSGAAEMRAPQGSVFGGVAGTLLSSRSWEDTETRKGCQVHCGPTTKIMFSVNKVWRHTTKASADRGGNKPGRSLGNTPSSSAEQSVMRGGLWGKSRVGCVKNGSFPPPTPRAALSGEYQRLFSLTLIASVGEVISKVTYKTLPLFQRCIL